MFLRKTIAIVFIFISASGFSLAAYDFPYAAFTLKMPAYKNPFPGLGANYCTLGGGLDTAMWNPAGLAKIGTAETRIDLTSTAGGSSFPKSYHVNDSTFEVGSTNTTGFTNSLLFSSDPDATFVTTREFTAHINYQTVSTAVDFNQAIKVGDNFALGISTRGDTGASIDLAGSFPVQWVSGLDLNNVTNFMGSGISTNNGKLTYHYTPSGMSPYTYTSEASVWSGFLNQTQRLPLSAISDSHDDINVQSNYTMTGAGKWGGLSFGANLTPISATANIDNSVRLIAKEGTGDIYFYVPNFDPNNQASVIQWMGDSSQYGTQAGYNKRSFRVPAGETVAEARYQGFYQASTIRGDIGAMYDLGEILTLGFAMENVNGAALNFKGSGRVAYVNSRFSTSDSVSIIDPSGSSFNFFSDTFSPVKGTENIGMLPDIPVTLPQRLKIGATLRKPFLITIDYEQQSNPLSYRIQKSDGTYTNLIISDIKLLRGGLESQLLFLPLWLKGGITMLLKPTVSGYEPSSKDDFEKAFQYGMVPMKIDLGLNTNLWGYEPGGGFGVNLLPILFLSQLDTVNQDFSRMIYYNLYLKKDIYQLTFMSVLDPGSTASAYSTAPKRDGSPENPISIIKMISTLTLSMRF
ncbi:MAG: hypothetical protein WC624_03285 [Candidatus Margulisiibacteriota bacterium]